MMFLTPAASLKRFVRYGSSKTPAEFIEPLDVANSAYFKDFHF